MFRARGRRGQLSFTTKMIPDWCVEDLGDHIRDSLTENGYSWGTGLVFLHQIRGVKHSTTHEFDTSSARPALEAFLVHNHLDIDTLSSGGQWWIDVALEIGSSDGQCIAWRTDSHFHVVKKVCKLKTEVADRITKPTSGKYTRDLTSHLPSVSGCRISPGPQARGRYGVEYLQLYTTDKSHTYHIDHNHYGKYITCSDVLKGKAGDFVVSLYQLFVRASMAICSQARIEVRVPIQHATTVLYNLDVEEMRRSLVSIPRVVWWYVFRLIFPIINSGFFLGPYAAFAR